MTGPRLLLVDNFDSFVFNLAQSFGALGAEPIVVRNDRSVESLEDSDLDALVISPGPGTPEDAGVSVAAIAAFAGRVPVLGVCLGHQCIVAAFGGKVGRAGVGPVHGKTSRISHDHHGVFRGLPSPFEATRYHSLSAAEGALPGELTVTARSDDGEVMGVRHVELAVEGVQFHPESVLTPEGDRLLENFLEVASLSKPTGRTR
jgi:anthranilate synthase/aminodeoxychorismate synthase-like glutamine amidotransferase